MNYCRKCQSDYEKPGTCNCFADRPRVAVKDDAPHNRELKRLMEQLGRTPARGARHDGGGR